MDQSLFPVHDEVPIHQEPSGVFAFLTLLKNIDSLESHFLQTGLVERIGTISCRGVLLVPEIFRVHISVKPFRPDESVTL